MRIIRGTHKGLHIIAPRNLPVRPTTDLGKESLFNILNNYFNFNKTQVLDLFAGTGNITYEFASREALSVIAVDSNAACAEFIRKTAEKLQFSHVKVLQQDAFAYTKRCKRKFDIVFADPPYPLTGIEKIVENVFTCELLNLDGWLIIEHSKNHDFTHHPKFYQQRSYGKLNFSFLVNNTGKDE